MELAALLEEICIRIMAINPPNDHLGEDKLGGLNRMVTSLRSACQLPGYQEQENLEIDQCRKSTCNSLNHHSCLFMIH